MVHPQTAAPAVVRAVAPCACRDGKFASRIIREMVAGTPPTAGDQNDYWRVSANPSESGELVSPDESPAMSRTQGGSTTPRRVFPSTGIANPIDDPVTVADPMPWVLMRSNRHVGLRGDFRQSAVLLDRFSVDDVPRSSSTPNSLNEGILKDAAASRSCPSVSKRLCGAGSASGAAYCGGPL